MVNPDGDESSVSNNPDVVWLHGAGLSGTTWPMDIGGIKPDLPGHGTAAHISSPSVERYADTIEPLLPDRFALVGHSLGGMVALELAARHPSRVRALVLAEAVPTVRQSSSSILLARIGKAIMGNLAPERLAWLSGLSEPVSVKHHLREQMGAMTSQGIKDSLEAAIRYDGRRHLHGIKVPTLIIVAKRNKATHAGAKLFHEGVVNSQWMEMPGGHIIHVESPDPFYRTVLTFLKDKR